MYCILCGLFSQAKTKEECIGEVDDLYVKNLLTTFSMEAIRYLPEDMLGFSQSYFTALHAGAKDLDTFLNEQAQVTKSFFIS